MEKGEVGYEELLGLLLESNHREIVESGHEKGMSIDKVISECKLFYLAGQETTAILIVRTLILLSKHYDWQAKAREEILQVFEDKEPNFDGLLRFKTVDRVLRLYLLGTGMYRKTYRAARLGAYYLPLDVIIFMPVLLVHHDQQVRGKDAQVFNPKRFSGVSKASTG
ncbi:cytochrome P450 72A68-like isoform X2 [Punica granatum]|nr:cytochrome P450 72A68-like isoform X2 [Punica granatum]